MHEAIKQRNISVLGKPLQYSLDLSIRDAWENSAVHPAIITPTEILRMVLANKPDIEARTKQGEIPLYMTAIQGKEKPFDLTVFSEGAIDANCY